VAGGGQLANGVPIIPIFIPFLISPSPKTCLRLLLIKGKSFKNTPTCQTDVATSYFYMYMSTDLCMPNVTFTYVDREFGEYCMPWTTLGIYVAMRFLVFCRAYQMFTILRDSGSERYDLIDQNV
jgi:hypothetical protein